jgi:hypothetical protein
MPRYEIFSIVVGKAESIYPRQQMPNLGFMQSLSRMMVYDAPVDYTSAITHPDGPYEVEPQYDKLCDVLNDEWELVEIQPVITTSQVWMMFKRPI